VLIKKSLKNISFGVVLLLILIATAYAASLEFTSKNIDTTSSYLRPLTHDSIDLDEDGDTDVVIGDQYYDKIHWYRNDGSENFTKLDIDTSFTYPRRLQVIDLDEDGDLDVVVCAYSFLHWYRNDGSENFTEIVINASTPGELDFDVVDVDSDGDLDIATVSYADGLVLWYSNDGAENFTRNEEAANNDLRFAYRIVARDFDGDTDIDFVVGSQNSTIAIYKNDGSENFTRTNLVTDFSVTARVKAIDVDGDTDLDVVAGSGNSSGVIWLDNDGSANFTEKTVGTSNDVSDVAVGDLDADGDIDVIVTDSDGADVLWFDNDGSETFSSNTIDGSFTGARSVDVIDVDGDGDLDVTVGSSNGGQGGAGDLLDWYQVAGDTTPPTITSVSSNTAAGSYKAADVIDIDVTFNEAVTSTGNVTVTLETGDSDQTCTFAITNSTTGTCDYTVQAGDSSADLDATISGTIKDQSNNTLTNYIPSTTLAASEAIVIDTAAPATSTLSPADEATGIDVDTNLVITFDQAVDVESGNITIKTGETTTETIDVTSDQVTGTGTTEITINPSSDLALETVYYVQINATAFDDETGNSYAGIADSTTWNFTTDEAPPTISATTSASTTSTGTTLTWTTDNAASSQVEYGLTSALASSQSTTETDTSPRVTSHSVDLSSLVACTTYYYQVKSTRATSTQATDTVGNFTTTGCSADATIVTSSTIDDGSITIAAGGTLELVDANSIGVELTVPVGFHDTDSYFQINQIDDDTVLASTAAPSGFTAVDDFIYEFRALSGVGTAVTTFDEDITITMTYADADISSLTESSLQIFSSDGTAWTGLTGCVVDATTNTVTCDTDHFSSYGLFGTPIPAPAPSSGGGVILLRPKKEKIKAPKYDAEICNDLQEDHWAYQHIDELLKIEGYPFVEADESTNCRPNREVKRSEFVAWIVGMQYADELEEFDITKTEEMPFSDLQEDYVYTPHIIIGNNFNIVDGYDDGSFRPEETISRAELLKILLYEFRGFRGSKQKLALLEMTDPDKNPVSVFEDIKDKDDWSFPYLYYATSKDIVEGRTYKISEDEEEKRKASINSSVLYSEAAKILNILLKS